MAKENQVVMQGAKTIDNWKQKRLKLNDRDKQLWRVFSLDYTDYAGGMR
jgi:hypothetical protein